MADTFDIGRMRRVEQVFHEALEHPPTQRDAFVQVACEGDDAVRHEVTRLLRLEGQDAGLLDSAPWKRNPPPGAGPAAADPIAQPGACIGRYRLLERAGGGGMGTVWLAERADRHYEQRVALKLIKRGMDTEDILRRFRKERQVLAGLRHPNIASLLDGGATEDGRPYLVMEFVGGRPIDVFCRVKDLTVRQRLELFRKVCRAVQHAHSNLVIHRDLKPSNILINEEGEPKLLDFGIAKLLSEEGASVTATSLRVMTPLYASPEQVRGDRITTASDVYSLGVILYELLTGASPYELTADARRQIEHAVLTQQPMRPSAVVGSTSLAARGDRTSSPGTSRLRRELAGDLDTIVLKALEKDPHSRYGSPEQLADDVHRFLEGRPILARPTSLHTRLVKAMRRNRRTVIAAAAGGGLSLILAISISFYIFVVPHWVEDHLDKARLRLLHPHQSNAIYISVYWHDAAAGANLGAQPRYEALAHYDAALRLYPLRQDVRLERDIVRLASGLREGEDPAELTPTLQRHAPTACAYATRGRQTLSDEQLDALKAVDCRSLGLLALLTDDFNMALRAWSRLDLVSNPDPIVEGLLGILFLAVDEPARAYPRLTTAHRAFPEVGFLCVSLADAAAHCGDVDAAAALIERAKRLSGNDDTGGVMRVEADVLAAAGRWKEAAAAYDSIRGSPVAWVHHADMMEDLGRRMEALSVLANAVRFIPIWMKVNRIYIERSERWWAQLDENERASLIEERRTDDPSDPRSFSALLFAHRVASLALDHSGHPVAPIGRLGQKPLRPPQVTPSLGQLSDQIPIIDLKAWVTAFHVLDETELGRAIESELAGPLRTLSPRTRHGYESWESQWRAGSSAADVHRYLGFASVPTASGGS